MISVEYVRMMARYNAWQNQAMTDAVETLDDAELRRDRGAFFGSIFETLNHILWGDRVWMSRIDTWRSPGGGIAESTRLYPTLAAWKCDRQRADARITLWADRLRPSQLRGDLTWGSALKQKEQIRPVATCVVHMFNHQTHHRGQVHAMLTAAGAKTQGTDLLFMPEDI